jgi:hypothetical protein
MKGKLMNISQRFNEVLNHKIEVDLDKRINRNKGIVFIIGIIILLSFLGYFIGTRWFWIQNKTYQENRIESLQETLQQNPESSKTQAELALATYLNGGISESIKTLKEVLANEPENRTATLYLGLILSEQKDYKESTKYLSKYISKYQGIETKIAYLYLGQNYLAIGDYNSALKHFNVTAKRDAGNPVVYLGKTHEGLNDKKSAILNYEKALEIAVDYKEADVALKSIIAQQPRQKPAATDTDRIAAVDTKVNKPAEEESKYIMYYWVILFVNVIYLLLLSYKVKNSVLNIKTVLLLSGSSLMIGLLIAKIPLLAAYINIYVIAGLSLLGISFGVYHLITFKDKDEWNSERRERFDRRKKRKLYQSPLPQIPLEITQPEIKVTDSQTAVSLDKEYKPNEGLLDAYIILGFDAKAKDKFHLAAQYFLYAMELDPPIDLQFGFIFDIITMLNCMGYSFQAEIYLKQFEKNGTLSKTELKEIEIIVVDEEQKLSSELDAVSQDNKVYNEELVNSFVLLGFDAKARNDLRLAGKYFAEVLEYDLPFNMENEIIHDACDMFKQSGQYQKAIDYFTEFARARSNELTSLMIKDIENNIRKLESMQKMLL